MLNITPKITAIIPARLHSTRLPEKVLLSIGDKSIVQLVYENLKALNVFDQVIIATDHIKIYNHVRSWEGSAVMTSPNHICGTDRIAEVAEGIDSDYILNVQADEPMLGSKHILPVLSLINANFEIGTAYTSIESVEEFQDSNVVKLVTDKRDQCLYFSRAAIPFDREGTTDLSLKKRHLEFTCLKNLHCLILSDSSQVLSN